MDEPTIVLNHEGATLHLLPYGGALHKFIVNGRDIIIGPEKATEFRQKRRFRNTIIGRYCSRLPAGTTTLENGATLNLKSNEGDTVLHGGAEVGFDQQDWSRVSRSSSDLFPSDDDTYPENESEAILGLDVVDGEQGFPCAIRCEALYQLRNDEDGLPQLLVVFRAVLVDSKPGDVTPISLLASFVILCAYKSDLTQHTGYTLCDYSDKDNETVHDHIFHIKSTRCTELDSKTLMATGKAAKSSEHHNKLDRFNTPTLLREGLARGIDDPFILDPYQPNDVVVTLEHPKTAAKLSFRTNQSCVVVYAAEMFDPADGSRKDSHRVNTQDDLGYPKHGALFLEFQHPTATFLHPELQKAAGTDTLLRHGGVYENFHSVSCKV